MTFSTIADGYNFLVRHWHSRICRDAKGKGIVLSPGIGFTLCLDFLFYCQIGFSWKDERSNAIFIGKFSVVPFPGNSSIDGFLLCLKPRRDFCLCHGIGRSHRKSRNGGSFSRL